MVQVSAPVMKSKDVQMEQGNSTVVNVDVSKEMPPDYFIWSLICFSWVNPCCLGLAALIHSVKARDRKVMGDIEGARENGSTAKTLNIVASWIVFFALVAVLYMIIAWF